MSVPTLSKTGEPFFTQNFRNLNKSVASNFIFKRNLFINSNPQKRPVPARDFEPKIPKFRQKNQFFWYLKIVTSQFSKIKKNNFSSTLSVPSFKKIGEPHKKKYKELPGRTLRFRFVLRKDALFASASFCEKIRFVILFGSF